MQKTRIKRLLAGDLIGIYLVCAAIVFIPLFTGSSYLLHLCALSGIYFILISGFNLCAGVTGLFSFAHGGLYAISAYTSVLLFTLAEWPWILSAIAGMIAAMMGGAVLAASGYFVKAFYLALSTLACGTIVFKVLWNWVDLTGGQPGIPVSATTLFGYKLGGGDWIYIIASLALFSLVVCRNIMLSRTGRALKIIAENEVIAYSDGINVPQYKFMVFIVSAFFAGLAGILYAYFGLFIDPSLASLEVSFSLVIILLVGGFATLFGPVIGVIIYIFLPAYLGFFEIYWALIWGVFLIVILLRSPHGVWGMMCDISARLPLPRLRLADSDGEKSYDGNWSGPINLAKKNSKLLEVRNVVKNFGGLQAVSNVNLTIESGCIHGLIGPNGSGKTTLVNLITGFNTPDSGEIMFDGKRIDGLSPHQIVDLGIARTFQGITICEGITTLDNLLGGRHCKTRASIFSSAFATAFARREEEQSEQFTKGLAGYFDIADVAFERAENLGDGQRRRLDIARALASGPKILILDEPVCALSEEEIASMMQKLRKLRDDGLAIFLIEHHIKAIMDVSDIITVLNFGVKIAEGSPAEIRNNEDVITAYLGRGRVAK
jgi:branched-chain amino acid transport system permease protein